MRITAIIPARNEQERIVATIEALGGGIPLDEIVVVSDGSADATCTRARGAGAQVIELPGHLGKGAALEAGASCTDADLYLLVDADLASSASQMALVFEKMQEDALDLAIASFPRPTGKAGFGFVMRAARDGIVRYGHPAGQVPRDDAARIVEAEGQDTKRRERRGELDEEGDPTQPGEPGRGPAFLPASPLSGQRILTRACMEAVRPFASGYGVEVAMTIDALRCGMSVDEVPTTMSHRDTGRDLSGILHRARQYRDVRRALARYRPGEGR